MDQVTSNPGPEPGKRGSDGDSSHCGPSKKPPKLVNIPLHQRSNCANASLYEKMTPQLLKFRLGGSPKRKAYRPIKRTKAAVAPASLQFDEFLSRINRGYNLLSVERFSDKTAHWAIIHGEMTTATPISTGAPIHNPRMIVQALHNDTDIKFTFEANFTTVSSGRVSDDTFDDLMQSMLPDSSYYLCPGMPLDLVEKCTFEAKNARKWMPPFQRIDHTECEQWFKNVSQRSIAPTCSKCLKLRHYLYNEVKRRAAVTSVQLAQRTLPTSRCPIKHLTPSMREKRMALLRLKKNE